MKLGIALSGGGAKGAIHLGIVHALEKNGIKGDMFAGTSAGAIIAAAKAFDMDNNRSLEILSKVNNSLLDLDYIGILLGIPNRFANLESLMKGKKLKEFLLCYFNYDIRSAKYPLSVVSTDISSGAQIIFSSSALPTLGSNNDDVQSYCTGRVRLHEMIYASAAIPGLYPPFNWEDHRMVDGAVVNNMPSNVLNMMGADKILAINIGSQEGWEKVNGLLKILNKSLDIMIDQNVDYALASTKNYMCLYPEITGIGALDFNKAIEGYAKGYAYGESITSKVKAFLDT